jgi:DNA-binding MarR family transcriptional regulator
MSTRGDLLAAHRFGSDEPSPPSNESVYRFLRCGHILGSVLREILEQSYLGKQCRVPVTRTQFCLLKLITVNANLLMGEIAGHLGVSPAAVSKSVDKLEQLGLVSRCPAADDRRATLLSVTEEGDQLVREYEALKAARIAPAVNAVDERDLERLCELLEKVCVDMLQIDESLSSSCLRCSGYFQADCSVAGLHGGCALQPAAKDQEESNDEMPLGLA